MSTDQNGGVYSTRYRRSRRDGGGGIVLALIGLIALAWTQGFIDLDLRGILPDFNMEKIWPGFNWGLAWPIFLLIPGALLLAASAMPGDPEERAGRLRSGIVLVALSAFFFASSFGLLSAGVWPVLLVMAGLLILLRPKAAGSSH